VTSNLVTARSSIGRITASRAGLTSAALAVPRDFADAPASYDRSSGSTVITPSPGYLFALPELCRDCPVRLPAVVLFVGIDAEAVVRALAPLPAEVGERADAPAAQGGGGRRRWKDVATLTTCYQHADEETLLAVMSEPRKRLERRLRAEPPSGPSSGDRDASDGAQVVVPMRVR